MTVQLQSISPVLLKSIQSSQNDHADNVNHMEKASTSAKRSNILSLRSAADDALIQVTTSVTTHRCSRLCPCQCHARLHMNSPGWLRKVVGQMLLSYHTLLRTTACDYPPCRKTPRKTEFTYYFPHWLAQKAFIMSSEPGLSGRDASISIAMPIIIPGSHPIWNAVKSGNVQFIQQLFRQGE